MNANGIIVHSKAKGGALTTSANTAVNTAHNSPRTTDQRYSLNTKNSVHGTSQRRKPSTASISQKQTLAVSNRQSKGLSSQHSIKSKQNSDRYSNHVGKSAHRASDHNLEDVTSIHDPTFMKHSSKVPVGQLMPYPSKYVKSITNPNSRKPSPRHIPD